MCYYHRWTCAYCSTTQDQMLQCMTASQRRQYCEFIQPIPAVPQFPFSSPRVCRNCGYGTQSTNPVAQSTSSQPEGGGQQSQAQVPPQGSGVRRGINLEETLKRYDDARGEVLAQAETKAATDGEGGDSKGNGEENSNTEDTLLQKAWKKLKKDLKKA